MTFTCLADVSIHCAIYFPPLIHLILLFFHLLLFSLEEPYGAAGIGVLGQVMPSKDEDAIRKYHGSIEEVRLWNLLAHNHSRMTFTCI